MNGFVYVICPFCGSRWADDAHNAVEDWYCRDCGCDYDYMKARGLSRREEPGIKPDRLAQYRVCNLSKPMRASPDPQVPVDARNQASDRHAKKRGIA